MYMYLIVCEKHHYCYVILCIRLGFITDSLNKNFTFKNRAKDTQQYKRE